MAVVINGCKWPPDSTERLRDLKTGLYDVSIRPCVHPDTRAVDPCATEYYKRLLSLYQGPALTNASCLRRLVQMDKATRMNGEDPNYSLYPEMGNVLELVQSIRAGKTVRTIPTNDPTLTIVRYPPGICNDQASAYSQDLVVLVKSCVTCAKQRQHARQTYMQPSLWTSFKVQFVFVLGLPAANVPEWLEYDGVRLRNPIKQPNDPISVEQYKQALVNESNQYGDLLIGDFIDSYYNLTLKLVTTFRWVSAFCRHTSALYLFIDNDYALIPTNVITMIHSMPTALRLRVNAGTFGPMRTVLRPKAKDRAGRYDVSENEIPWFAYPAYSSGAAYVIGADLVTDAAIAMAYTLFLRFDDAYLGFVWSKLHVPVMIMPEMRHTVKQLSDPSHVVSLPAEEADKLVDWKTGLIKSKL